MKTLHTGLDAALDSVSPKVKKATLMTHERLAELGIPHVLIGGIAVGVHGYQYATKDVDWLVSQDKAFEGIVILTHKPGVPVQMEDVAIDYLMPEGPANVILEMQNALEASAADPERVIVASEELLVWMKLKAGRSKDMTAVVELLKAGALDVERVWSFLDEAGDEKILRRFDAAKRMADEEDRG